jgi:2-dehydro-3-deoxyphosphogluconate aldolase/(4S)-4-hydroxy-2-oxoglutarate aldolase
MEVWAASDWRRRDLASVMEAIAAAGIVAVLRASDASRFERVAKVLVEAGVTCVEFTLTSRGAVEALRRFEACMPAGITLGAGTVLEPETVDAAIDAGASYLVSPTVGLDMIERARRRGVAALPGAFTPTEILRAWRAGADAVRFVPGLGRRAGVPAGGQGAAGRSAAGPDRWGRLEEIRRYLDAGALAVGLGRPAGRRRRGGRGPGGAAAARRGGRRPSARGPRAMTGGGVLAGPSSAGRAWRR